MSENWYDESLEREGYEHSNSLNKCQIHLVELDEFGTCHICRFEKLVMQDDCL